MTPEERIPKIELIGRFPQELRALIDGLTDEQLMATPIEGEWNIAQNVHHCGDSHMNSIVRLKLILTEEQPPLKPYAEAEWAKLADGDGPDLEASLQLLDGLHVRWCQVFSSLTEAQWQRTGTHGDLGQISAEYLLDMYVDHCNAHLAQIARVKAALG